MTYRKNKENKSLPFSQHTNMDTKDNRYQMIPNQITKKVNINKATYKLMHEIADFFIKEGGIVFGGFVRDSIIHEHYAKKFYGKICEITEKQTDEKKDGNVSDIKLEYSNICYDEETKLRLLIPKDIDVFFTFDESDVELFFKKMNKRFKFTFIDDPYIKREGKHDYFELENGLVHKKLLINDLRTSYLFGFSVKVKVDFLYSTQHNIKPPFRKCDLSCNSLLLTKYGVLLSDQANDMYFNGEIIDLKKEEIRIIENILLMKTEVTNGFKKEDQMENKQKQLRKKKIIRFLNMKKRGWDIEQMRFISFVKDTKEFADSTTLEGLCVVCQDSMVTSNTTELIRLNCCNTYMHTLCLIKYLRKELEKVITPCCPLHCSKKYWNIFC